MDFQPLVVWCTWVEVRDFRILTAAGGFLYPLWAHCSTETAAGAVALSLVLTRFDNIAEVKPCFLASWVSFLVQLSTKTHANPLFKPRVCSMSVSLLGTPTYVHTVWTLPASLSLHPHPLGFSLNGKTGTGNPTVYLSSGSIAGGGREDSKFFMNLSSSLSCRGQWTLWPILKVKLFIFFKVALLLPLRWNLGVFQLAQIPQNF